MTLFRLAGTGTPETPTSRRPSPAPSRAQARELRRRIAVRTGRAPEPIVPEVLAMLAVFLPALVLVALATVAEVLR